MATLTVVITYSGTLGTDAEVSSFTSGGTAYAALTAAQIYQTRELMTKAAARVSSDKASTLHTGAR